MSAAIQGKARKQGKSIPVESSVPRPATPSAGKARRTARPRPVQDAAAAPKRSSEEIFLAAPDARIDMIKAGFPAGRLDELAARMGVPKDYLLDILRLSRATVNRKIRSHDKLAQDETERVLGLESLIGQVETMVRESGNPDGFDAARWLADWLATNVPALGGKTAASYMDTVEGQKLIAGLLATAQSGAYA